MIIKVRVNKEILNEKKKLHYIKIVPGHCNNKIIQIDPQVDCVET